LSLAEWNERYRSGQQLFDTPSPLVARFVEGRPPGIALDLACGPGRNALYLAALGWKVTAVDGSPIAIETLQARARDQQRTIDAHVADLEADAFAIQPNSYDLICDCYYLQRSLIPHMQAGLRPGGLLIAIVHLADPGQPEGTPTRAVPGELRSYFPGWKILHYYEGKSNESCHQRPVAELVAQRLE
jgi:SAM-dependent methyltransferase